VSVVAQGGRAPAVTERKESSRRAFETPARKRNVRKFPSRDADDELGGEKSEATRPPELDMAKIELLRNACRAGSLVIDPHAIAAKMLERLGPELFSSARCRRDRRHDSCEHEGDGHA